MMQSFFAGKSVKLDDVAAPVLYPRYVDPADVTVEVRGVSMQEIVMTLYVI